MKILIIYASAGAGHKKAAEAIYEALLEKVSDFGGDRKDIRIIDSLDYTNKFFKRLYSKRYLTLVSYLPNVWGFFYYLFDNWLIYQFLIRFPRRIINAINCRHFENFLCQQKPDIVITTHFMANEVISALKQKNMLSCRLFSAVTDYRTHSFWVASGVDCYFVAAGHAKNDLLRRGIFDKNIYVTGIPISPKFSPVPDKQKTQIRLGLNVGLFTALIIGGGFGVGPVEKLVNDIAALPFNIQFLVVCGHNEKLYENVSGLVSSLKIKAKVFAFVDNVHELMAASDLMVTKSGGLTSAEALACGLPAIFINPIPGQETRNSRILQSCRAASIARNTNEAKEKIRQFFEDPDALNKTRIAIRKIARPNAARDIVKICMQM